MIFISRSAQGVPGNGPRRRPPPLSQHAAPIIQPIFSRYGSRSGADHLFLNKKEQKNGSRPGLDLQRCSRSGPSPIFLNSIFLGVPVLQRRPRSRSPGAGPTFNETIDSGSNVLFVDPIFFYIQVDMWTMCSGGLTKDNLRSMFHNKNIFKGFWSCIQSTWGPRQSARIAICYGDFCTIL